MARNLRVGVQRGLRQSIGGGLGTGDIFTLSPASFDFSRTKTKDSRITFTRASSGTFVDADGLIKSAATNTARFDHDPATGKSLGLLIEESRTNLVTYSEQLDQWTAGNNTTVTTNAATAPDGTNTAARLVFPTNNSTFVSSNAFIASGTTYTASVYVKAVTPGTNDQFTFNFGGGVSNATSQFTATGEWQRFTATVTPSTNAGAQQFFINNEGDGFRSDIYVWGVQVEEASFATSYISTTSSQVTRAADVVEITGTNFSSFYNSDSNQLGTMFVHAGTSNLNNFDIVEISNGNSLNRDTIRHAINDTDTALTSTGGGQNSQQFVTTGTASIRAAANSVLGFAVNGTSTTDAGNQINNNSAMTQVAFGRRATSGATDMLNGHIKRFAYFPENLDVNTLKSITSNPLLTNFSKPLQYPARTFVLLTRLLGSPPQRLLVSMSPSLTKKVLSLKCYRLTPQTVPSM